MATLYRKYRPQRWSDIAGQNHIKATLAFGVESGRIAHAYIFSGPRGVGKTTIARILARALNCLDRRPGGEPCGACVACLAADESRAMDIIEIDAASHRGIDNVRDNIIEGARFSPTSLKFKVFIIDEVHMLTPEAFNALLKTLEEPPAHAIFILATTELHKVPATVVSRCQRFDFRRIPFSDMVDRLHSLSEREGVKVDRKALEAIARQSDGCLRDAEGLLGKVLSLGDGKRVGYDEALVVLPRTDWQAAAGFAEALLRRDARTALLTLDDCLESGIEPERFAGDVLEILRQLLLMKMGVSPETAAAEADDSQKARFAAWREMASVPEVTAALEMLLEKQRDMKFAHPPQLPLELAVARICEPTPACPVPFLKRQEPDRETAGPAPKAKPAERPAETPLTAVRERPENLPKPAVVVERKEPAKAAAEIGAEDESSRPTEASASLKAPAAAGTVTLERVREIWDDFVRQAGERSHALTFLLGCAKPLEVKDGCLTVGFDYAFHSDKFNQDKSKRLLEEAFLAVSGEGMRLSGTVVDRGEQDYTCYVSDCPPESPVPEAASAAAEGERVDAGQPNSGAEALAAALDGTVVG